MYISEIQKRLTQIVSGINHESAFRLAIANGANPNELTDGYHIALWFEGAPKEVKEQLLDTCDPDHTITVCDYCGKFMTEGFLVYDDPYCSEDCAVKSYIRDTYDADNPDTPISEDAAKKMFSYDRTVCPEEVFWTEWY